MILIISVQDDLHALTIHGRIRDRGYKECHIIECDRISQRHRISLHIGQSKAGHIAAGGHQISISDASVIWYRRPKGSQTIEVEFDDPNATELINNDCRGALWGLLMTNFKGKWISAPDPTFKASDKIFQLSEASSCGFRVPETVVTQHRQQVVELFRRCNGKIVVKNIVGVNGAFLLTRFVDDPLSIPEQAFEVCPAIYQEYIPGTRHIRLNCFGEQSFAAVIDSPDLDWRPNLNVPIRKWNVPAELHSRVRRVLDVLGLEMGIIDLKETPEGEFVWLEVNPQGQFLFLDAVTDLRLADNFADYLIAASLIQDGGAASARYTPVAV